MGVDHLDAPQKFKSQFLRFFSIGIRHEHPLI